MSASRLFLPFEITPQQRLVLPADRAHYVERVLRLRAGDELCVFDGSGVEFPAVIVDVSKHRLSIETGQPVRHDSESPLSLHLVQAVARAERMDFVVQKATELGVSRISPVLSERTVVRLDRARAGRRHAHWSRVVESACEQCGRNTLPQLDRPVSLAQWFADADEYDAQRLVLKHGVTRAIGSFSIRGPGMVLLVGPEGGLSDDEYAQAEAAEFEALSAGPRVLRSETAALAAVAILQARSGDLQ